MSEEEFRRLGYELVDQVAEMLATIPQRSASRVAEPAVLRQALGAGAGLPERGSEPSALLRATVELLSEYSLFNGHPRFFGYITSSPAHIGILGEMLAAAVNANVGSGTLGPMATEIEAQTIRWIAELLGYPEGCGGLLVSGGNMANMVALLAARTSRAAWDVRAEGLRSPGGARLRVYVSAETHTWIQKAADLSGLGTESVRWIPTDGSLRMDMDALRRAIRDDAQAGDVPMMVVGTAGTVSTGAVDPLREIAGICRAEGMWFHVDGAYGAFAAALPDASADLRALALADSVAVDPHKWLYAPLEAGCVLVRDPRLLTDAFSYHPPYYNFQAETINYVDYGPQNSRGFRALKVWLALKHAGRDGYVRMIGDDIRLAERLFAQASEHDEFEAVSQALSITTFRYVPPELRARLGDPAVESYLNEVNEAILQRMQRKSEAFVSHAVIRGRYVLRACTVNFNTTEADIDALPHIVADVAREVTAELTYPQERSEIA